MNLHALHTSFRRKSPVRYLGWSLVIILGIILNPHALAVILSIPIVYRLTAHIVNERVFDSKLFISFLAIFLYIIILQCITLSMWVINKNFPLDQSIYVTLLFLMGTYLYSLLSPKSKNIPKIKWLTTPDIFAFVSAGLILMAIYTVPILQNGFNLQNISLVSINASIDDSHHIEFINDRLQFNRGILFHSDSTDNVRNQDVISSYPAGWHSANAAIIKALYPNIQTGTQSISAYVLSKIFWYFVLLFVFTRTVFCVYKLLSSRPLRKVVAVWLFGSSLLFAFFFLVAPFRQGFYSFIPQIIAVLLLMLALAQLAESIYRRKNYSRSLILAVVLCVGGGLPWILVLPGMGVAVLVLVAIYGFRFGLKQFTKDNFAAISDFLPLYLIMGSGLIVQLYIMAKSNTTIPFIEHLITQGSIEVYGSNFYMCITVGLLLAGIFFHHRSIPYIKAFSLLLCSLLLITAVIGIIHFFKLYDYSYYYFKALNVFTAVAIVIALAGFALVLERCANDKGDFIGLTASILLFLVMIQFVGPNPGYPNGLIGSSIHGQLAREEIDYVKGGRVVSNTTLNQAWQVLENSNRHSSERAFTVHYNPGKISQNEITTLIIKTNFPQSRCSDGINLNLHKADSFYTLTKYIHQYCTGYKITILTDATNVKDFQRMIQNRDIDRISVSSSL